MFQFPIKLKRILPLKLTIIMILLYQINGITQGVTYAKELDKKQSKKYLAALDKVDTTKQYAIEEAIKLCKEIANHFLCGAVDDRHFLRLDSVCHEEIPNINMLGSLTA